MARPTNRVALARRGRRLRSLRRRSNRRVPVEHPTAAVADHQFALAQLVPHLRTHTHPASGALLILGARQACATAGCNAIEAREQLGLNLLPQSIAFRQQRCSFGGNLLLPQRNPLACLVQSRGQFLYLGPHCGKRRFLYLGPFQAGKLLGVQALNLAFGKANFVLNRRSLRGCRDRIKLRTVARGLLPMSGNVALQAVAKGILSRQRVRSSGSLALRRGKRGFCLRHLGGQGSCRLRQPGPLQVDRLQLYKIFNVRMHSSTEVYAIGRLIRKRRAGIV